MNFTTAKRILKTQGMGGLISAVKDKVLKDVFYRQTVWCLGKLIALRGNVVTIEGCQFSVDSPVISPKYKGAFVLEEYEGPERRAAEQFLDRRLPVIEFGGSVGVVSCLVNRMLDNPNQHVVVEGNPALIPLLKENRSRNDCKFDIIPRMVAYGSEEAVFHSNRTNFLASTALSPQPHHQSARDLLDEVEVQTTSLESVLKQYPFNQCTLICDIEGAEAELIAREGNLIKDKVKTLIIEVHECFLGKNGVKEVLDRLEELGFHNVHSEYETYVFVM